MDLQQCLLALGGRDAFIGSQPLARFGNVVLGDRNIEAEVYRHARLVGDLVPAKLGDRPLKHFCVEIEPKRVKMTRLLTSKDISRAAKFEVQRSKTKTGT